MESEEGVYATARGMYNLSTLDARVIRPPPSAVFSNTLYISYAAVSYNFKYTSPIPCHT